MIPNIDRLKFAPSNFWEKAFGSALPAPGYESLTMAMSTGLAMQGDFVHGVAPWQSGWQRLYQVLRDTLRLENPYSMGCSVGGQLALDLAAERPERFAAFISLNGWYDNPTLPEGFSNDVFRTPPIADSYADAIVPVLDEIIARTTTTPA